MYAHNTKMTSVESANPRAHMTRPNPPVRVRPQTLVLAVTLACTLAGGVSKEAFAQNLEVDLSDPNVSVDLSVLDDGGLGGGISASTPGTMAPAHALPEAKGYISELYISPEGGIDLPPPGHPRKETQPAEIEKDIAEAPAVADDAQPDGMTEVEEATAEVAPVAPEQVVSETTESTAKDTTESVAESVAESAPTTPAPEETVATETREAAPEPEATVASTPSEPAPAPLTPEAAQTAEQAPEPAQPAAAETTAVTETAPPPPAAPETEAAKVVVELPQPAAQEMPAATEQASLPPADGPLQVGDSIRVPFDASASKLPDNARAALKSLAARLQAQDSLRLQLLAYAGGDDLSASKARRLSLSRALSVRSFLIENGVRSTRIDVRALGNKVTDSTPNRVDVNVVER